MIELVDGERKKRISNLSLGDKYLTILDEIVKLKREADKAQGYHVSRGSREEYLRYSRTKAAEDCIDLGGAEVVRKYNKIIQEAKLAKPQSDNESLLNGDEAIKRKIMDLSGKGWSPLGGAPGW